MQRQPGVVATLFDAAAKRQYWKRATDGFDIILADVTLASTSIAFYDTKKTDQIDWIVVKK